MILASWSTNKQLEELTTLHRNNELVKGHIRSLKTRGEGEAKQTVLIIALANGVTAYCTAEEFGEREYRNYNSFIGQTSMFKIKDINLETQVVMVSEKEASTLLRQNFWEEIELADSTNSLKHKTFQGVITGYNRPKGIIYLRIQGQDCYMYRNEWSWEQRPIVDAETGETIEVKIQKFDKETGVVRVSRRLALPDPYEFIRSLETNQILSGRVVEVHPIHGIYVAIEDGVELKAGKRRELEEPEVGDHVRVRFQRFDEKTRKGRVVILEYPGGKRKKKDIGSFLFN